MTPVLWTAVGLVVAGLVVLAVLAAAVSVPLRRFARARRSLERGLTPQVDAVRALVATRPHHG